MRFKIRKPFAVHLETYIEEEKDNGQKVKTRREQSFFPGQDIDLTEEQALAHLHKLEPSDPASIKFLKDFHADQDEMRAARIPKDDTFDDKVAAAVDAALARRDAAAAAAAKGTGK